MQGFWLMKKQEIEAPWWRNLISAVDPDNVMPLPVAQIVETPHVSEAYVQIQGAMIMTWKKDDWHASDKPVLIAYLKHRRRVVINTSILLGLSFVDSYPGTSLSRLSGVINLGLCIN